MEMRDYPAMTEPPPAEPSPRLRTVALTAVWAGLVLVAGAAFVLSYQGIHQIVLNAGVSGELARLYPVMLDAMLVMCCAAALALRTAGVWTRCYVWGCLIVLLVAVATGNAMYAMHISLPAQPTRAVVAVLPWALLLVGFGMLLAMLRHWRRIRAATAAAGPARPGGGVPAGATVATASWAGGPGSGPARPDAQRSGIKELTEPRAGQPPQRAAAASAAGAVAAGAAGARAASAGGQAPNGERPGPAMTAESARAAGQDGAAPRPPAAPADEDLDVGPPVSYEAEPAVPAVTSGPARANGPAATKPAGGPQGAAGTPPAASTPASSSQPAGGSQPPGGAQPASGTQAAPAPPITGGTQAAATPPTTEGPEAPLAPPTARGSQAAAATPTAGGTPPAAIPPTAGGPQAAPAPPSSGGPQAAARTSAADSGPVSAATPGTTAPFLQRILGGPTNPNAPEADGG